MTRWWEGGVLYHIYPRSFADSNGDGIGDLRGIINHLDYLDWLGVRGLWLSPVTVSPNADWGYDVADYCAIDPALGTLADFDDLVQKADARGIRILFDLVPNHTSAQHPWFRAARSGRDSPHRDWYVWADPRPGGRRPNNWINYFGVSAWTYERRTRQYYLHNFLPHQPDLNWWNPAVRAEFDRILRFWYDRGVAGIRIDVCNAIIKDKGLRNNPPVRNRTRDTWFMPQQHRYNANRPEVHEILRHWRTLADTYDPPRLLLGETNALDLRDLTAYYGNGDELDLAFNFLFWLAPFRAGRLKYVVDETEKQLGQRFAPVWAASNHDISRFPTRWARGDPARIKLALLLLLTLRGTIVLYYGDELGMPDTRVARRHLRDPLAKLYWPFYSGRDRARTPMPWANVPGAGFTDARQQPWLPFGSLAPNVADQQNRPDSVLHFCRRLIALRREHPDLAVGPYHAEDGSPGLWRFRRGERLWVVGNVSPNGQHVAANGELIVSTAPLHRTGTWWQFPPWSGALFRS